MSRIFTLRLGFRVRVQNYTAASKYDNAIVCSWPATCHVRDGMRRNKVGNALLKTKLGIVVGRLVIWITVVVFQPKRCHPNAGRS